MKHRLRHPIRQLKEPFGKAGLTVAVLALVMAMVGGAYAAGGLTKSQEKQVTKIAKKYAGKPGANGANGAPGEKGAPGINGTNGTNGASGAAGTSVVTGTATAGECPEASPPGGATVEVGGSGVKKAVCNGKEGSPWTAGGTLPSGATETGSWLVSYVQSGAVPFIIAEPISFSIPLAAQECEVGPSEFAEQGLCEEAVHYVTVKEQEEGTAPEACEGTAAAPIAQSGNLCVYGAEETGVHFLAFHNPGEPLTNPGNNSAATTGIAAWFNELAAFSRAQGTWAVTAE